MPDERTGDTYLRSICRTASTLLAVPFASVTVLEEMPEDDGIGLDGPLPFGTWLAPGEHTILHDMACDEPPADSRSAIGPTGSCFYAGVALKLSAPCRRAMLCVVDVRARPNFGDEEIGQLRDMAAFVEAYLDLGSAFERRKDEADALRMALDGMAQGLIVVDADDRVTVSNRRAAELLEAPEPMLREGVTLDAFRRLQEIRGEFAGLPDPLCQWLETESAQFWEPGHEHACASGAVVEVCSRPMAGGGTIRTITDVTVKRAAEQALRESERRLRLIADNVGDIIILTTLDFTCRYVSPSVTAVLGYEPDELVSGYPADLVHPDDFDCVLRSGHDLRRGRAERTLTTQRYRHRDGSWIWLEVSSRLTTHPATGAPDGFVSTMRDVTARKLAEEQLRFSEARQRALVDALPQMMAITAAETGEPLYTNLQFKHFFGPAATSRSSLVHPDDHDRYRELWVNARARQGRYEGEVRLRRRDGAFRWHKVVMVPVVQDGTIHTVVSTALDIDEIITGRRDLERTTDLLRLAQAAAGAGVWEWDLDTDQVTLSAASARMHGLPVAADESPTVVPLEVWKTRVNPEDLPAVWAAVKRNRSEGTINVAEFRIVDPEHLGRHRWVQSFGRLAQGADPTRFVGLHLDVTARREAENVLRLREATLRASEERLTLALDSGDDGLFDADLQQGGHWISRRWVERLGYDAEVRHRPMEFWWTCVHPDDFDHFAAEMDAHRQGLTTGVDHEHRLRRADGTYIWVLVRARVVARSETGEALRVVGSLIDISQRKESELRIRHMAEHDALTGLPNRQGIHHRLARVVDVARIEPERHALLVCDIDRFRVVNDTLGHLAGDRVLCAVATRIRSALRPQDVVARLGGDEFAVLLADVDGRDETAAVSERIIAALQEPIDTDRVPISIGISLGAAVVTADGASAEEVFTRADVALYEAKAAGRNTYRLFEAEAHARATSRNLLALDLPEGMRRKEFFLVYQPIIDAQTGAVSSCEALMRWRHPIRGLVSPGEFISVAEDIGAIVPLGAWALREACIEAAAWPGSIAIAVNVSTVQMSHDIERSVREALEESGLSPNRLVLEVTESALMLDSGQITLTLRRLKEMGVRIALDDFGTGYSSLSYLRFFAFDKLKIDHSFIRDIADPDAAAIVRAVTGIGEHLGMSIVAEGVETAEQLDLVKREGCREIQGFLFSRPLLACDARAYLAAHPSPG